MMFFFLSFLLRFVLFIVACMAGSGLRGTQALFASAGVLPHL